MLRRFDRWTWAWLTLSLVLALHVAEEVMNGTLAFYRGLSDFVMDYMPFVKLPPFRYEVWLVDLIGASLLLIAMTWLVHRRRGPMRLASYVVATFAAANGMMHILMSMAAQQLLPGVVTSPLILAAALFLLLSIPADEDTQNVAAAP